jgi:hypothetical protein
MLTITVLDTELNRMRACEQAVKQALKQTGMKAVVTVNAEPPYLARLNVWDRLPALEINGKVWNKKAGDVFTAEDVVRLLQKFYSEER